MRLLHILTASLLSTGMASAALAEGPGRYGVTGAGPGGTDAYNGSAVLAQTGKGTWTLRWTVGKESYSGTGIGDGQVLAFSFGGSGGSGTALYQANPNGGYTGIWAFQANRSLGTETLTPMQ